MSHLRGFVFALVLACMVVACGSSGGPGGTPSPPAQPSSVAPVSTTSAANGSTLDACALLTTSEIGAVTNSKASPGEPLSLHGESSCRWALSSGVLDYVEATITPTGGRQKFDMYADDYYEVDPEHVTGIGDDALKTGTLPGGSFYVVKGDELLTLRFSLPLIVDDPYSVVQVLAENAAFRM